MVEPITSGKTWVRAAGEATPLGPTNIGYWVRPNDGSEVRAWFKAPGDAFLPYALYALGMERVAYELGDLLDLPIPPIHLEAVSGTDGCLSIRAGGQNAIPFEWAEGRASSMTQHVVNEDMWPLAAIFDLWIANVDRTGRHIILDPVPAESLPHQAKRAMSWFIDHEKSGLWWPRKINPSPHVGLDVEALTEEDVDGPMAPDSETMVRNMMPTRLRLSLDGLGDADRRPLLENVLRVTDDEVRRAVVSVPVTYMSERMKFLTIRFLQARRDRIDTLVRDVFTSPKRR